MGDLKNPGESYTVVMPKLGLIMTEALLIEWQKKDKEWVTKDEVLFTMENDKSTLEIEAPTSGYLKILVAAGEIVPVQTPICVISQLAGIDTVVLEKSTLNETARNNIQKLYTEQNQIGSVYKMGGKNLASPKARTLARKIGVELSQVQGNGPRGMIVYRDVEALVDKQQKFKSDIIPMSGPRAVIAERLSASWHERPQVTLVTEIDATDLVSARQQILLETGKKVSYNAFFMAAVARTLVEQPHVNIRLVKEGICYLSEINIGLAVDTNRGLLVPVIHRVEQKSLLELDEEIKMIGAHAIDGRSTPEELSGGTFTITNLGQFGTDAFTPIINPPEAAILGIGRIAQRPFVIGGQLTVRETTTLSLSFDHRLLDGAPAARFLQRVAQLVERPMRIFQSD